MAMLGHAREFFFCIVHMLIFFTYAVPGLWHKKCMFCMHLYRTMEIILSPYERVKFIKCFCGN